MKNIAVDLQHFVEGEVINAVENLKEFATDFGGMVEKSPQVVVRAKSTEDVVRVVQYASEQGLPLASRAMGHSISGQSLSQGGIVLDLRGLNAFHEPIGEKLWFEAEAGATWRQVLDHLLPQNLVPPVITNYLDVSLGGTHSSGGLGASSFRHGSQADNCLGLEVVTGEGELVWCTAEENSDLFYHVLGGYGQFGIITRIRHRARRYQPSVRTYLLFYDDLDALLADKQILIEEERVDHLVSIPSACVQGISRAGGVIQPLIQWFYTLQISVEGDALDSSVDERVLAGLNFYRHIHTEELPFQEFIIPPMEIPVIPGTGNPWTDMFLTEASAKTYIEATLKHIPAFLDFTRTPMGAFCLLRQNIKLPMFRLPGDQSDELVIGFGLYPTIPQAQLAHAQEQLALISAKGTDLGAKRYLTGWLPFDQNHWRKHFGNYWPQVNAMKKKYDPQGILNPGFIQYES
jgi:cytokinin dehydrogenase